ncbi:calcineurin-like phosphoesterase family protein [Ureibacillus xyleni]|uniref:Calcineurin-like phosphoesterase family protein n=1 Tax=Ureibacillus xyleni TaxID=614648 RepID=A0A285RZR0_9BACL|nr:metallophosphoesterase family protein [Ureibacillus xyleni]SOB99715.1 calcineurin-like phosphoesterase family protein [Ureibacillus xyleni]
MKYALLGDLHSNIEDTKAVLNHIHQVVPNACVLGLGDLYECIIGKKKASSVSNVPLDEAAVISEDFEDLLTFPSIRGNQEERITQVTGIPKFCELPDKIVIEGATLLHGHQIKWDKHWEPTELTIDIDTPLLFFGHSHRCGIYRKRKKLPLDITYGEELQLIKKKYWINVGSVVDNREWCLYDSVARTITFMKSSK